MARSLLGKGTKAAAQRALLLTRSLPPAAALEVLVAAIDGSTNEFIRATAAVQLGQLWPPAELLGSGLPPPPPPPLPPPGPAAPDGPREATAEGQPPPSSHPPPPPSVVPVMTAATAQMCSLLATAPEVGVRSAAAAGLGYLPPTFPPATADGVPALLRSLVEDADWQVHFSALVSLGTLRARGDAPLVVASYLAHPNDLLVQAAVGALGDMGEPASLGALLRLVNAGDVMVRQRLADALGKFGGAASGEGGNAPAVPPELVAALVTLGGDPSRAVREAAVYSAKALGVVMEGGKRDRLERTFRMDTAAQGGDAGEENTDAGDDGGRSAAGDGGGA
ncbi:hypothetical protein MMPV_005106 [Pyropia vietnamensis]